MSPCNCATVPSGLWVFSNRSSPEVDRAQSDGAQDPENCVKLPVILGDTAPLASPTRKMGRQQLKVRSLKSWR